MESFQGIEKFWKENKDRDAGPDALSKESLEKTIRSRIRREKKTIVEYFWASFVYQILIYAFMCHLFVKHWGNAELMVLSLAGAALYIPFTVMLMKKFRSMYASNTGRLNAISLNMYNHVLHQYKLLSEFFSFKKKYDWVAVPLSCLLIVLIIFKLYTTGGVIENLIAAIILFIIWLAMFTTAIYYENKKRFKDPLDQLESILRDMKQNMGD